MLTVTPKQPNDNEYTRVSNEVSGGQRDWEKEQVKLLLGSSLYICMEMDVEANLKFFADFFCFSPLVAPFLASLMHTQFQCTFPLNRSLFCMSKGIGSRGIVNIFLLVLGKFGTNKADNT